MPTGRPSPSWAARLRSGRVPEIDVVLPGISVALGLPKDRIRLASGTRDEPTFRRYEARLRALWVDGDPHISLPLLRALLVTREIRIADVDRAYQLNGPAGLAKLARTMRRVPLDTAITAFLDSEDCPKKSRAVYTRQLHDFAAVVGRTQSRPTVDTALERSVLRQYLQQLTAKNSTHGEAGKPVSPATRNRYRAALSALCSYALREGWIAAHPMVMGQVPIVEEAPPRLPDLTVDEIVAYLDGVDAYGDEERALATRVLLHCGPDVGEVLTRRVAHLVPVGDEVFLRFKREKVRHSPERLVPVPAYLAAALRGWIAYRGLRPRDLLFPTLTDRKLAKAHEWGIARAQTPDLRRKDLRHLAAQAWRQAGFDLLQIKDWLGHSTLDQTQIYAAWAKLPNHQLPLIEQAAQYRIGTTRVFTRADLPAPNAPHRTGARKRLS